LSQATEGGKRGGFVFLLKRRSPVRPFGGKGGEVLGIARPKPLLGRGRKKGGGRSHRGAIGGPGTSK